MKTSRPLRIALFTHSINPRGGVVHALELGQALTELGHHAVVHAPDPAGAGFFRKAGCEVALVPATHVTGALEELVRQRTSEYLRFLEKSSAVYDVYHAGDPISANALAYLAERGQIRGYIRTVHHLDTFDNVYLRDCQDRSVITAARVLCVSKLWRSIVRQQYAIDAGEVPNGVNLRRFTSAMGIADGAVREKLGISGKPVFLGVGGIEPRKNSIALLRAFVPIAAEFPQAQLVIAGGATLLDHAAYREEFDRLLQTSGLAGRGRVVVTGVVPDEDMPALFRLADALVFPSVKEGFGLVVLEAMASGTPVVCPEGPPFTEYLNRGDAVFVDPCDAGSITAAMRYVLEPAVAADLREAGWIVSRRFSWEESARTHLRYYEEWVSHPERKRHAGDVLSRSVAR